MYRGFPGGGDERSCHLTRKQVLARGNLDQQYNFFSWALNSFGVPLDDFLPGAKKQGRQAAGEMAPDDRRACAASLTGAFAAP